MNTAEARWKRSTSPEPCARAPRETVVLVVAPFAGAGQRIAHHPAGPCPGHRPDGGTYVFVGAHWRNRLWPYLATAPRRLIYVFNTFHPKLLALTARHPALLRWPRPEFVFISEFQKTLLGIDGQVHPSPIDIDAFLQLPRRSSTIGGTGKGGRGSSWGG